MCAQADTIRVLTFNTGLARKGPGLLVRDLGKPDIDDIAAVLAQIAALKPDIAVLQGVDYDHDLIALSLIRDRLTALGVDLPHIFAGRPNTGRPTPFDLDRDGRKGRARDKQGFGYFNGYDGIAVLSRFPVINDEIRDLSAFLWRDLPGAKLPQTPKGSYYTKPEQDILRLHTTGAWIVPIFVNGTRISLGLAQTSPPVFDGPEDRNGRRNRDEIRFWSLLLDGEIAHHRAPDRLILAAGLNADPIDGEGSHDALNALLTHTNLQDPRPHSDGARAAADDDHRNPPEFDTADWPNTLTDPKPGPGNLRVDYLLPTRDITVNRAGVDWPEARPPDEFGSAHRPVWIDITVQ